MNNESRTIDTDSEHDLPISVRLELIREQLDRARAILRAAQERQLPPQERFAVSQLARTLADLTDAVRSLETE